MSTPASKSLSISTEDQQHLETLEAKINAILPPRYVGCFEDVPAGSMGSAELKFNADGQVAWGEIWTTFCHLALAGGPPHRGTLLDAATGVEAEASPAELRTVAAEIERAIHLTTELKVVASPHPGWIAVRCHDEEMAAWLVRAIVAENVMARRKHELLLLPVGPKFRLEKEIKNVVVSLAKSCHYLLDHIEPECRPTGLTASLVEPPLLDEIAADPGKYQSAAAELRREIQQATGSETVAVSSHGWIGVKCDSEEMAVWMQRAVIVENVLARREGEILCVPVSLAESPEEARAKVVAVVAQVNQLWLVRAAKSHR